MTPESAYAVGYSRGRADERNAILKDSAEHGVEVLLIPERSPLFVGRCRLCGEPARGFYCHEHEWMYGEPV